MPGQRRTLVLDGLGDSLVLKRIAGQQDVVDQPDLAVHPRDRINQVGEFDE